MQLEPHVEKLLHQRYYLTKSEDWQGLVTRIVDYVCQYDSEAYSREVEHVLAERIFLPNSPCLVNAGKKNAGLMACFVAGPDEDTLENHLVALSDIAHVAKFGGGCGFPGTFIRGVGKAVAGSAHGYSYGPLAWAKNVSGYMHMMTQSGFRRMALMFTLKTDHPDIRQFITFKQDDEVTAYNLNQSIMATDEWMWRAVNENGLERGLFDLVVESAWNNGEPGLLFYDTINNNTPYLETIEATNPCGEQPLPQYGCCNLASINLAHPTFFNENGIYDFTRLAEITRIATRFLDNLVTVNRFPNERFEAWSHAHRPIGLGVMGYADALLKLDYTYGAQDSLTFLERAMQVIAEASNDTSQRLGEERGIPSGCTHMKRRNITLVSIAPTGSIAIIAGCSHGIEPVFAPRYKRTDERGETYIFDNPYQNDHHFRSCLNDNSDKIPTWRHHLDVQIAAQRRCDSAVSKTINLTNSATPEEVRQAFIYAWENGLKGITIYRDGSRSLQVLEDVTDSDAAQNDCPNGVCEV